MSNVPKSVSQQWIISYNVNIMYDYCSQPFSGKYYGHKEEGVYTCVCCGSELFSSKTKYDSGSGWPSFYAEMEQRKTPDGEPQSAVIRRKDVSHGMVRVEVICRNVINIFVTPYLVS